MELPFAVTEDSNNDEYDQIVKASSSSSSSSVVTGNSSLLQSVALYDNVHTEHFYTPATTTTTTTSTTTNDSLLHQQQNQQALITNDNYNLHNHDKIYNRNQQYNNINHHNDLLAESTFVTIKESDTTDYHTDDTFNEYSNITSSVNNYNHVKNYGNHIKDEYVTMNINSYKQRQKQQQEKNKGQESVDILSLLISSCFDDNHDYNNVDMKEEGLLLLPNNELSETKTNNNKNIHNNQNCNFIQLCNDASKSATIAKNYTQKGDISQAITQHLHSAKLYKDAAFYLKSNFGNSLMSECCR